MSAAPESEPQPVAVGVGSATYDDPPATGNDPNLPARPFGAGSSSTTTTTMMPPMSLSDTPNAWRSSDRASPTASRSGAARSPHLRRRLPGVGVRRNPRELDAGADPARPTEPRESPGPVGDVDHRGDPVAHEDARLADPRGGPHVPPERVALVGPTRNAARRPGARRRPAERTPHRTTRSPGRAPSRRTARPGTTPPVTLTTTPRLRAKDCRPPARERIRRSIRACPRRAPPPKRHRSRWKRERAEREPRARSHRRHVADVAPRSPCNRGRGGS